VFEFEKQRKLYINNIGGISEKNRKQLINLLDGTMFSYLKIKYLCHKINENNTNVKKYIKLSIKDTTDTEDCGWLLCFYLDTYIRDMKRAVDYGIKLGFANWLAHNELDSFEDIGEFSLDAFFIKIKNPEKNIKKNINLNKYVDFLLKNDTDFVNSLKKNYEVWIFDFERMRTNLEHHSILKCLDLNVIKKEDSPVLILSKSKLIGNNIDLIVKYLEKYEFFLGSCIISANNVYNYYNSTK